tara:strand:+ start:100 stop:258 length:159 start_codon:yes stop_codon:yes gene_type:complete
MAKSAGLYANIHKRRKSGKPMRKKGQRGAPSDADFKRAAKTAKKKKSVKKKK